MNHPPNTPPSYATPNPPSPIPFPTIHPSILLKHPLPSPQPPYVDHLAFMCFPRLIDHFWLDFQLFPLFNFAPPKYRSLWLAVISAHPKDKMLTYIGQSPSHQSTWTLDLVLKFLLRVAWKHAPLPSSTPKLLIHPQRKYIHRYTCYACMSRYFLFMAGLHVVTRKPRGRSDRRRVAPAQRPTVSYVFAGF